MFVMHTQNLVEGRPYGQTPYLWNPYASVGTSGYPAGTAILLSPVYAVAGLNLTAFKWVMIVCFFGGLLILGQVFRGRITRVERLIWLALVGLNPYFWDIKENVQSDLPFLLFLALSLWCIHQMYRRDEPVNWAWMLDTGLVFTLSIMTRSAGIVLVPALLLYDLWYHRSWYPSRRFVIPVLLFSVLYGVQGQFFQVEGGTGYSELFTQNLTSVGALLGIVIANAKYYILAVLINLILENGYFPLLKFGLAAGVFGLSAWGFLRAIRQLTIIEVFTVCYMGLMLIWPYRQPSYLIPMYPILFYYLILGWKDGATRMPAWAHKSAAAVGVGLLLLSFGLRYTTLDFRYLDQNVVTPAALEMYEYIREEIPSDEIIICRVPRSLSLFTNRSATSPLIPGGNRDRYNATEQAQNFAFFEQVTARYAVTGPKGRAFHQEVLPLWHLVQDTPERFEPVFTNAEFGLYLILPPKPTNTPPEESR